jgi:D-glycero-D-manno-heptose 1,7-bisphosphate phosphatase
MRKHLFLDRDGVLNLDVAPYVTRQEQLKIFSYTGSVIKKLNDAGFDLYVCSNQQGVSLGITPPELLDWVSDQIRAAAGEHGGEIKKFYYCTARDDEDHRWRKPNPGMIYAAGEEFGFDHRGCFFIGDWWKDMVAARAAECRPLLVLSGVCKGDEYLQWPAQPEAVFPSLVEAADYAIANSMPL